MALKLDDAIRQVTVLISQVNGIRKTYDEPVEQANISPFAIVYPKSGEFNPATSGWTIDDHIIGIEVLKPLVDMAKDVQIMRPFVERVGDKLIQDDNIKLADKNGATVERVNGLTYTFGPFDFGGVPHIGAQFELDVTIKG